MDELNMSDIPHAELVTTHTTDLPLKLNDGNKLVTDKGKYRFDQDSLIIQKHKYSFAKEKMKSWNGDVSKISSNQLESLKQKDLSSIRVAQQLDACFSISQSDFNKITPSFLKIVTKKAREIHSRIEVLMMLAKLKNMQYNIQGTLLEPMED